MMNRPPLGIMPRAIWLLKRKEEIEDAILRFREAQYNVPDEWYDELILINDFFGGIIKKEYGVTRKLCNL